MTKAERLREWRKRNPDKCREYEARRSKSKRARAKAQWRAENPDLAKAIAKKYRDGHPGKNADGARKWRAENPERAREISFRSRIKREYGISAEEYRLRVAQSKGICGLCGEQWDIPNLDHCHNTGKLRDILCQRCNRGLGHFYDSAERLRAAASYIERHAGHSDDFTGDAGC